MRAAPQPERQVAFRLGISAESRAAAFLIAKGFRIRERRWRSPVGEIDIIARRRHLLVLVEVKAREKADEAAWSITDRRRARVAAAAEVWLARQGDHDFRDLRFDAVLAVPGRVRRQIPAAFEAGRCGRRIAWRGAWISRTAWSSPTQRLPGKSMSLKIAVQMDPIERINIRGDSTFALLLEAQRRGHAVSYYTPDRMALTDGRLFAAVQTLTVRDQVGDHFTLGEPQRTELAEFDVVLLRQDPPFDLAYVTTTHLLERIAPHTLVVNDPAQVRNAPEKLFVMDFPDLMPPTLITRDLTEIKAFRVLHGDIVMKPLYGKGGEAVFRLAPQDLNFGSLYDLFAVTFREQWVVQKFLPAVREGDKRIILVDGEFGGAVNRVPAADDLRSNMVRGGAPKATDLTARERDICARIGPALRERGLLFVGIDVIDGFLTEINVTSPTGIRAIKALGGPDVAAMIWDRIEAKRG
jgi:glutathione synthase